MINSRKNLMRKIFKGRRIKTKKPVNIPIYDIPQISDERWNELAEKNRILRMKNGVAV